MAKRKATKKTSTATVTPKVPLNDEEYRSNNVHVQEPEPVVPQEDAVAPDAPAYATE